MGRPIDGKGPLSTIWKDFVRPPNPLQRKLISESFSTGIKSMMLLFLGQGQRIGIFSGSGVVKSVLLGMIGRGLKLR